MINQALKLAATGARSAASAHVADPRARADRPFHGRTPGGAAMSDRCSALRRRTAVLARALVAGALVLSGCSVYDVPLPGGADVGKNPITVTVMFRDVLDLVPQSTVKVDDVTVGKVKRSSSRATSPTSRSRSRRRIELPDNARARSARPACSARSSFAETARRRQRQAWRRRRDRRSTAPAATPRSKRSSAPSRCCSTAAASASSRPSPTELNNAFGGREGDVRVGAHPDPHVHGPARRRTRQRSSRAIENINRLALQIRKQDGTIKCPRRHPAARCGRSTASAPTWSSCSRRWTGSAGSACG